MVGNGLRWYLYGVYGSREIPVVLVMVLLVVNIATVLRVHKADDERDSC